MEMTKQIVEIMRVLRELGMHENLIGFLYTVTAVDAILNSDHVLRTMEIYTAVEKAVGIPASRVERSIRHSIKTLYATSDTVRNSLILGTSCCSYKDIPSNSTFLSSVANYIRIQAYEEANKVTYHPRPVNADGDLVFAPDLAERKYVAGWGGGGGTGKYCPNLEEVITCDTEA